jgi:Transmembrane protein 43
VEANAVKLKRKVEVYQWEEKSESRSTDNYGGSETTTTTYTYSKKWSDRKIDSTSFNDATNYSNPVVWKYDPATKEASGVTLGDIGI